MQLLLQSRPLLWVYGSLSVGSPHVVEPDCRTDSGARSDLLLWRNDHSEYFHGRYAWICGTSSRPHPSRFLHLGHASSGVLSTQGTTHIPTILTSHWEGHADESHSEQAGSSTMDTTTTGSSTTGSDTTGSSDGTTHPPATSIFQRSASNPVPADSAAAK